MPKASRWRKEKTPASGGSEAQPTDKENVSEDAQADMTAERKFVNEVGTYLGRGMRSELARCDAKLAADATEAISGGSIYLREFFCKEDDFTLFKAIDEEIANEVEQRAAANEDGFVDWSKHRKLENPEFSRVFQDMVARLG